MRIYIEKSRQINPINLLPRIRAPKLILHGRYDESAPLKPQSEPLQKLLREPKRIILFDGGHMPSPEIYVTSINEWLDETLGPVRRRRLPMEFTFPLTQMWHGY